MRIMGQVGQLRPPCLFANFGAVPEPLRNTLWHQITTPLNRQNEPRADYSWCNLCDKWVHSEETALKGQHVLSEAHREKFTALANTQEAVGKASYDYGLRNYSKIAPAGCLHSPPDA